MDNNNVTITPGTRLLPHCLTVWWAPRGPVTPWVLPWSIIIARTCFPMICVCVCGNLTYVHVGGKPWGEHVTMESHESHDAYVHKWRTPSWKEVDGIRRVLGVVIDRHTHIDNGGDDKYPPSVMPSLCCSPFMSILGVMETA
ncbi:hypothetical protein B296_00022574 [Ensete ventricosum]|uniref:Uncharacterized protein n=1 Tax=Ensete ventricosum TaxID=4639 RepID=A0A427AYD1_ENSVE|nr:hypothetical protein B296_00022574 [Ensete ventricosum]